MTRVAGALWTLVFALATVPTLAQCLRSCATMPCCAPGSPDRAEIRQRMPCCEPLAKQARAARPATTIDHDPPLLLLTAVTIAPRVTITNSTSYSYNALNRRTQPLYRMHCALLL